MMVGQSIETVTPLFTVNRGHIGLQAYGITVNKKKRWRRRRPNLDLALILGFEQERKKNFIFLFNGRTVM